MLAHSRPVPPRAASVSKGPTVATLTTIEEFLRKEARPVSRYRIRLALGNRVGAGALDQALAYMAGHEMVYDEGPGGKVVWIRAPPRTLAKLRGS